MATSGSNDFSVSRDDILTDALENLGVLQEGQSINASQTTQMARKLNMIVKQWQGASDFAPGLKMWSRKRGYIFLQKNQGSYTLGPSGDEAASTYVTTTTTAAAALGASTINISSATGMSASDNIGIELADGSLQWTTISGSPGTTTTLAATLTGAVNSGARVFTYTPANHILRPLQILTAVLRNTSGVDTTMDPMLLDEYEQIGKKSSDGTPLSYYYEFGLSQGTLYLDCEPSDVTRVIRIVYLRPIEDFDATADTPDYPQEWFRPLCAQLTIDGAPAYGVSVTPEMKLIRDEALSIARNANPENSNVIFQPNE